MWRNLTAKMVYRPKGVSELYDLAKDPRELTNKWSDPAYRALRATLFEMLAEWQVETGDVPALRTDPRGNPKIPDPIECASLLQPDPQGPAVNGDFLSINGVHS